MDAAEFLQADVPTTPPTEEDIVKDVRSDSDPEAETLMLRVILKDLKTDLERSEAKNGELRLKYLTANDHLQRVGLDLADTNRAKATLEKHLDNAQEQIGLERKQKESVQAALDDQKHLVQDLRDQVCLLSSRLCELVEERTLLATKVAFCGDELLPPLQWAPPRNPLQWEPLAPPVKQEVESSSQGEAPMADLSTFLGDAGSPIAAVSMATSGNSGTSGTIGTSVSSLSAPGNAPKPGGFGAWLGGGVGAVWSRAFGSGRSREEEFRHMLNNLSEVPPTRHTVRGPVSNSVDRLRLVVASPNTETSGVPEGARGTLWTEAVGNRLHISEKQYDRVCRRRDGLREVWAEMDKKYTEATTIGESTSTTSFQNRPRVSTAKTLFSQADSDAAQGIETEELYLIGAALEQIPLDVKRTLSSRDLATLGCTGPTSDEMRDLLEAFAVLKPEFGYTQGMNFLAAMLLIHLDSLRAFVCFSNLVMLQPWLAACYTFNMPVVQRYFDVFDDLLIFYVPRVGRHFQQLGLTSDLILVEWWFALFARSLPLPVVVRLWDLFFLEGDFLLYRASLAILQCFEGALVTRPRDECLALLSSWPAQRLDPDHLFDNMERMGFNEKKLSAAFERVQARSPKPSSGST